jgi:DsbC/DsbD-like thiol-disulfide interchange protein
MWPAPFRAALTIAIIVAAPGLARAAGTSPWEHDTHSAVRLLAAATPAAGALRAGVEIKLDVGWKTYWRYPGDSGVPPRFDFSGSDNVRDVAVLWPAPTRFSDGGGTSIGYTTSVVLPLRVTRADAHLPATLHMKLEYAICEKLCVPVQAQAELSLPATDSAAEPVLHASEQRVPKRVVLGADEPFSIMAVHVEHPADAKPRVVVDVRAPAGAPLDLLAEGPTADWSLPLPLRVSVAPPGLQRFAFDLDGLPPGAAARGARLMLTAISGADSIETAVQLEK